MFMYTDAWHYNTVCMQSTKKNVTQYKYRYLTIIVHLLLNYRYNYCLKIVIESRYIYWASK